MKKKRKKSGLVKMILYIKNKVSLYYKYMCLKFIKILKLSIKYF